MSRLLHHDEPIPPGYKLVPLGPGAPVELVLRDDVSPDEERRIVAAARAVVPRASLAGGVK